MAVKTSVIADPTTENDTSKSARKRGPSAHSATCQRKDVPKHFNYTSRSQIHAQRRREILEKFPEILSLYGYDPMNAVWCGLTVMIQLFMSYQVKEIDSIWLLLLLTYSVSGTLNHSLLLAMHEATHDLFFKQRWLNQLFATIANLPMGVPAAAMFRIYHSEHHSDMGVDGVDTDVPTEIEARLFSGVVGRLVWVILQPFFYAVRPMVIRPKPKSNLTWTACAFQILFDLSVLVFMGWKSFIYLFGGSLLGTGLHPLSGHFVAEHFEFVQGQETYSYYGPLNKLTYNVGYHNEHHDFPKIPGSRLPLVRNIAPEFYNLPAYDSWPRVIFDFILGRNMSLYGRVKRVNQH
jgi:sphingolipid delta-4 desaturase